MNKLISVAMTSYNGEEYIEEQVESIISQTYKNLEIIICDDHSSDRTLEILRKLKKRDKRITLIENNQNLGFKKNFEKAISFCKGDYIALSDQDDIWERNHIELLYKKIGNCSIACGNCILIDSKGDSLNRKLNEVDGLFCLPYDNNYLYKIIFDRNCFQGASMLLCKDFVTKTLPIPEEIKFHDVWFALNAMFQNGINYSFEIVNNYRQHGKNVTFKGHNVIKRSLCEKIISKIKIMFGIVPTDRFTYISELKKIYGDTNKDLNEIENFFSRMTFVKKILFLWEKYEFITTKKGHKGFIKKFIVLLKWRNIDE